MVRRKQFYTFGIFCPGIIRGSIAKLQSAFHGRIYDALILAGFRETRWQFVYRGQLGGLVLPCNDGECELHVRFYSDHITVEYEVGRSYLSHFWGPRYEGSKLLIEKLKKHLSSEDLLRLKKIIAVTRACELKEFVSSEIDLISTITLGRTLTGIVVFGLAAKLGWKAFFVVLILISAIATYGIGVGSLALVAGGSLVCLRVLPSRGHP